MGMFWIPSKIQIHPLPPYGNLIFCCIPGTWALPYVTSQIPRYGSLLTWLPFWFPHHPNEHPQWLLLETSSWVFPLETALMTNHPPGPCPPLWTHRLPLSPSPFPIPATMAFFLLLQHTETLARAVPFASIPPLLCPIWTGVVSSCWSDPSLNHPV